MGSFHRSPDEGFTLIELLIVIVILGVLAAVVVFAVGGVRDRGAESACESDLRTLVTAEEVHAVVNAGVYADELTLVSTGHIRDESSHWDVSTSFHGGYTIAPAAGSSCNGGMSADGVAGPLPDPGPSTGTTITFHGTSGVRAGLASADDEVVVFGRDEGWYDFRVAINAYPTTVRRVTFVHLDEIENEGDLNSVMSGSRTNGSTDWVIYPGDDTVTIPRSGGGDWPSVGAYLATVASPDPLHQLSATGSSLSALLSTFPTTG